jgi:diketogulonate reductase-like aldo/keto reductase
MGTFGSDKYGEARVSEAVAFALRAGYRMFDCASVYGNEGSIGRVFADAFAEGVCRREDVFVTSKVWNDMHGEGRVLRSIEKSLSDLRLDYVDAYFLHWPFPNYHAPGCDGDARNPDSKPFSKERFMTAWRQLEELYDRGLARYIGMSNMTIPKLEIVLPLCRVRPALIEMELHPSFQQTALFGYCIGQGIQPVGFCPIGSPSRPERDKADGDVVDTQLPEVVKVAEAHGVHPALVCLKWSVQRGAVPIPFSVKEPQILANLRCVSEDPLTDEEMRTLAAAERDCRLVKGQVFLWEGARGWEDLWDIDGNIAV